MDVLNEFGITRRLAGGSGECGIPLDQPPRFLRPAVGQHLLHTGVDPAVQHVLVPLQPEPNRGVAVRGVPLLLVIADRLAGQGVDFERPQRPPGVVDVDAGGGGRVDLGEAGVQHVRRLLGQFRPQRGVRRRAFE